MTYMDDVIKKVAVAQNKQEILKIVTKADEEINKGNTDVVGDDWVKLTQAITKSSERIEKNNAQQNTT